MLYLLEARHRLLRIFCMGYALWSDGCVSLNSLRNECCSTWGWWVCDPKDLKRKKRRVPSETEAEINKVNWEGQSFQNSRMRLWPEGDVNTSKERACYSHQVDQQWKLEEACDLMLPRHPNTVGKILGILTSRSSGMTIITASWKSLADILIWHESMLNS